MFANHVAKPFARSKLDQIRFGENLLIYHTKEQRAPTGISLERPFLIYCQCQGDTIFIFILQQTRSKSKCCNAYCIFRGHHDLINLLCMVVCHYTNIFSLVDENAIWYKEKCFKTKSLNEAGKIALKTGPYAFFLKMSRLIFILQLYFCIKAVAQDGMMCFRYLTKLCVE